MFFLQPGFDKQLKNKTNISSPFFGLIFSKDGVFPDPNKVEALKTAVPPNDKKELILTNLQ